MDNPLRKNHFAQVHRSFSSNKNNYSPQTIDKPALKWVSLSGLSILGQPPREFYLIRTVISLIIFSFSLSIHAEDKFKGEFWSKGSHFQLTGKAIPIAEDGIHDPTNITAMFGLQLPEVAMELFPRDSAGLTDWVQALAKGHIEPRSDLHGEGPNLKPIDLDIIFPDTDAMPKVLFPHRAHTEWLACKNCHPAIFVKKKGANSIKMADVLGGKYCGVCHGKIAFAPTRNCMRCHSVPKTAAKK